MEELADPITAEEAKKRTRKRKGNDSNRKIRKNKRNSGMAYTIEKGKKVFRNTAYNCKGNCINQINVEYIGDMFLEIRFIHVTKCVLMWFSQARDSKNPPESPEKSGKTRAINLCPVEIETG